MAAFPIERVRSQFPALDSPAVFLDNPAGTQVPRPVIDAVSAAMIAAASNTGGYFQASVEADGIVEGAHNSMAELLGGGSGREIVIGQSMTMLTFQISRSLGREWSAGDEIIVTRMDHEGNVSPWLKLAEERGLTVRWLPVNRDTWRIELEDLRPLLSDKTRLLALNYASNMTGSINPVAELTALAKDAGALVYVDAVQFAPHRLVDVAAPGCDYLACSSYKFFGPHLASFGAGRGFSESVPLRGTLRLAKHPDDTRSARRKRSSSPVWPPRSIIGCGSASRPVPAARGAKKSRGRTRRRKTTKTR